MKQYLKTSLERLSKEYNIPISDVRVGIEMDNDKSEISFFLWDKNKKQYSLCIVDVVGKENKAFLPIVKMKITNIFKKMKKEYDGDILDVRLYIKNGNLKGNIIIDYVPVANFDFDKYLS